MLFIYVRQFVGISLNHQGWTFCYANHMTLFAWYALGHIFFLKIMWCRSSFSIFISINICSINSTYTRIKVRVLFWIQALQRQSHAICILIRMFLLGFLKCSQSHHEYLCWLCTSTRTECKTAIQFFWEGLLLMEIYSYQWSGPKHPCMDPDTLHFFVQKLFFVFIYMYWSCPLKLSQGWILVRGWVGAQGTTLLLDTRNFYYCKCVCNVKQINY